MASRSWLRGCALLLVTLLLVAACASGNASTKAPAPGISPAYPMAAAPTTAPSQPIGSTVGQAANGPSSEVIPLTRMVIRSAKLSLQVKDVESALAQVRQIADVNGGYVTASHTSLVKDGDAERVVADVTIAVRSDTFDRAVQSVRAIASKVESEDGATQDVTEEYVDLDANLRNLQASESALIKLTGKADRLEDVLTLQRELANVRGQIERLEGRKRYLEHQTTMSTISVNLHLPPIATTPVWNPVATFERGWQASRAALETLADVLISVLAFGWWLILLVAGGVALYRRTRPPSRSAPPAL